METWKPIAGYENLYEVSDFGNVRSLDRRIPAKIKHVTSRVIKGCVLVKNKKKTGYFTVDLCKDSTVKTTNVHRIVAETFIPKVAGKRYVNHKDGNKENNNVSNLEWVTSSENRLHAFKTGLAISYQSKEIICIDSGLVFKSSYEAANWIIKTYPEKTKARIQIVAQNIRACANGKQPHAYGFMWKDTEGSTTIPEGSTHKRVEMGDPSKEGEDIV